MCPTSVQPLCYFRWEAEEPRGVIQIVHGLGDHAQRYGSLATRLAEAGYSVYAPDHIGHGVTGKSLGTSEDSPARPMTR
ncbi:MAG: alpha/beta hydrolase [Lawsonella clevelandensis]